MENKVTVEQLIEYRDWTRKTWSPIGNEKEQLTHAWLGCLTEIGELADCVKKRFYGKEVNIVNLKEEYGDFLYYYFRLVDIFPMEVTIEIGNTTEMDIEDSRNIVLTLASITSVLNKLSTHIAFRDSYKGLNLTTDLLLELIGGVNLYCNSFGVTFEDAMQCNVAKLETRYNKGRFNVENAANRDLDKERQALETGSKQE